MSAARIASYPGSFAGLAEAAAAAVGGRITWVHTPACARNAKFDALLLLGGSDVHPARYGEPVRHATGCDPHRDAVEWELLRRAERLGVPVLGICRGSQIMAAFRGGRLAQDTAADLGCRHPGTHRLAAVAPGLRQRMPGVVVNSMHHQAVLAPGRGLRVLACAPDGVVEAIGGGRWLGVQWHPEVLAADDPAGWLPLFGWWLSGYRPGYRLDGRELEAAVARYWDARLASAYWWRPVVGAARRPEAQKDAHRKDAHKRAPLTTRRAGWTWQDVM